MENDGDNNRDWDGVEKTQPLSERSSAPPDDPRLSADKYRSSPVDELVPLSSEAGKMSG